MKTITCTCLSITFLFAITLPTVLAQSVSVWLTTGDQSQKLQQQSDLTFSSLSNSSNVNVWVHENTTYQTMDGFGAAMTGSSAYLMNQKLSSSQRESLMNELFTDQGIRLSFIRHSIGASDFDLSSFSYNDMPVGQADPNLNNFSINPDRSDLIPMLKLAKQKNGSIKIMGTPWSAPAWMKETHTLNGGWLATWYYQTYANYLVKYIQAYQAEGLPVYAITLQNEPLHETSNYPSMRMDAGNQISFLKNNLGPAFSNQGIATKILAYDHNWDDPYYPIEIMNDPVAKAYVAGTAFHAYAGTPDAQTSVHNAHPDKGIWFTEISGGDWATNFAGNLRWNMSNIVIGATRNWAKSVLLWNLALDQNDGPTNGGCSNCRGVVTINNGNGQITKEVEYYVLGHISKFVDPGAIRIASNTFSGGIENVAFKNPDGSKAIIALNNGNNTQTFQVNWEGKAFEYTLAAGATATFTWTDESSTTDPPIGQTIWLKGSNQHYVSSENGYSAMRCNRPTVDGWELFTVIDAGNGLIALQGSNGLFVSSENGNSPMICNRSAIGNWESFEWIALANGQFALKGSNGKFVSSENGTSPMRCDREAIAGWETFSYGSSNQAKLISLNKEAQHTNSSLEIELFPNPINTNQTLHMKLIGKTSNQSLIQLTDVQGRLISSWQKHWPTNGTLHFSLSNKLQKGIYLIRVLIGDQVFVKKLLVD